MPTPSQLSFFDLATRYEALSHNGDPLEALAFHVPWEEFRPALEAVATEAIRRDAGARGMRAILETAMLDIMYEVPFLPGVKECRITKEVIEKNEPPLLTYEEQKKSA